MKPTTCGKCGKTKARKDFGPDGKGGLATWCKACKAAYQRAYAKARKPAEPKGNAGRRSRVMWYGITEQDYEDILKVQNGCCAGCGYVSEHRSLDIDHKHQKHDKKLAPYERALSVRGLLCHICNRVLGRLRDRPEVLEALAAYLRNPPAPGIVHPRYEAAIKSLK